VGTIEPRKNLVRALDAFAAIAEREPGLLFVLAGAKGWKCDDVYARAFRPDLAGRVRLLDYVDEDELTALYSRAAVFLYPSLFEGFGFPVLEAMACGAPVVTSSTTSLGEISADSAELVDPESVESIARGLWAILGSNRRAEELRRKGFVRAAGYTWASTVTATLDAYREAIHRSSTRCEPTGTLPV
jgi:glycosyltransferase involved in cell wall biosynthesis